MKDVVNRVLEVIEKNPGVRASEISEYLGIDRRIVYRALQILKRRGLIRRVGVGYYPTQHTGPTTLTEHEHQERSMHRNERGSAIEYRSTEIPTHSELTTLLDQLRQAHAELITIRRLCIEALQTMIELLGSSSTRASQSAFSALKLVPAIIDLSSFERLVEMLGSYDVCSEYVKIDNVVVKRSLAEELARAFSEDPSLLNPVEQAIARSYIEMLKRGAVDTPC